MKRLSLIFLTLLISNLVLFAQGGKEINLVVTGEAETKDLAVAQALRSAVEMSFGTFVSANTAILDDEIVKDEVATISSGNIKSFKELGYVKMLEGYSVTIEAVVSLDNLISYAKGKGSSCEFAGQTFAMNMKLKELNSDNELKAISHLHNQVEIIAKDVFDFQIYADSPKSDREGGYIVPLTISMSSNEAANSYYNLITNTLSALSLSFDEIEEYEKANIPTYQVSIFAVNKCKQTQYQGFYDTMYYTYTYVFRNKKTGGQILELLCLPFKNVSYKVLFADHEDEIPLQLNDFNAKYYANYVWNNKFLYPRETRKETSDLMLGSYGFFIEFPCFPLLKHNMHNNEAEIVMMQKEIRELEKAKEKEKAKELERQLSLFQQRLRETQSCSAVRATSLNDRILWRTNDTGSPFSNVHLWGTSMNVDEANRLISLLFRSPIAPLHQFEIQYSVSSADLRSLTGFSISRTEPTNK